jgi:integrase
MVPTKETAMSRQYELTWVKKRALWRKVYHGRTYIVSCKQLAEECGPVPENKEGSYPFAKRWWAAKKEALDGANRRMPRPLLPMEDLAAAVLGKRGPLDEQDVGTLLTLDTVVKASSIKDLEVIVQIDKDGNIAAIWPSDLGRLRGPEDKLIASVYETGNHVVKQLLNGQPMPDHMAKALPSARLQQVHNSVAGLRGEATAPADQTVEHFKDEWLRKKKAEVVPDRYANCERWIAEFVKHVGAAADVKSINAGTLDSFYTYCREQIKAREADDEKGWSAAWAQDVFRAAKSFVRWLSDTEKIDPPRNLSHPFRFDVVPEEPDPWTVEEVKTVLGLAKGPLRLYLLLALNCGYGSKDIADLRPDEVNLKAGVIDRYRSKAKKYKSRRKLAFALWPPTLSLLRQYAGQGERLLTTETGTPLRSDGRRDNIATKFVRFRERHIRKVLPGFSRTFYSLRKTSATLIGQQFGLEYARYFLNQSPRAGGVAEMHYVKLSPEKLAEAVRWLGQQLAIVEQPSP